MLTGQPLPLGVPVTDTNLDRWFICVRYDRENKALIRDFVKCATLKLALDTMMPGHIEVGWKVWEERPAKSGVEVLSIWQPRSEVYGPGYWKYVIGADKIYPVYRLAPSA